MWLLLAPLCSSAFSFSGRSRSLPSRRLRGAPQTVDASASAADASPGAFWFDRWWPLAFVSHAFVDKPQHVEVLGAPVVLWHDGDAFRAALDQCPHRLARLSEGRITEAGCVECPYHGWAFDGEGACTAIPQAGERDPTARAAATALPTSTRAGVVWVWTSALFDGGRPPVAADDAALDALTLEEEVFAIDGVRSIADYSRELPLDATMLLENVLDPSHLPYTHHDTISSRAAAGPVDLRLDDRRVRRDGFTLKKQFPGRSDVDGFVRFDAPSLVLSATDRGPEGFRDWNVVYAVPTAPGRCRLFVRVVFEVAKLRGPQRFIFEQVLPRAPDWAVHLSNHKVLEDDNIFLHHAGTALRRGDGRLHPEDWATLMFMPTAADAGTRAFRRWLDDHTDARGPTYSRHLAWDVPPGPRLGRAELIDRLETHTEQCAACSAAHAATRRAVDASHAAAFGFLSLAALTTSGREVLVGLALASYGVHAGARALAAEFAQGTYPPPRNR